MINPVLKWALQVLQNPKEIPANDSVSNNIIEALTLAGIEYNQIQVNCQPLESIFSAITTDDTQSSIDRKKIYWQALDVQQIVYPKEQVDDAILEVPELQEDHDRFYSNTNLVLALIEKYGTFLSISPNVPHISFYDIVKSAAAIHDCLEHGQTDKPFLIVSGDFSGIQDAIYTIDSSGALKTLRARSFMLELLAEHIIYEIQQVTGCGRYSFIFSGGGGFSLLVPNSNKNKGEINDFGKVINSWILEKIGLQLFLALHCEPVNADAIEGSQFKDTWELMADKLGKQKQRKFWKSENFKDMFKPKMPLQLENQRSCQITHRDDLPETEMVFLPGVGRVSRLSYRLWKLGDRLTKFKSVVRLIESRDDIHNGTLLFPKHQSKPNSFQYAEYKVVMQIPQNSDYDIRWLVNSWKLDDYDENTYPLLYGEYVRSIADLSNDEARQHELSEHQDDNDRKVPDPENITASFSGLAKSAQGAELIGCLRMDVDDFGDLFSNKLASLGIAALSNFSQSMNLFFKGYLNQICGMKIGKGLTPLDITGKKDEKKQGRDVSIVYAGGDDLFIVGAWDDVAELVFDINVCFREFSCCHPDVHLSAGVTLHKPKFPLYQMARMSKQAEEAAKTFKGQKIEAPKNSLSLFFSDDLAVRNTMLNDRIDNESIRHPQWRQKYHRIAVASQWEEYNNMIELTKQLHAVYPEISQGFYRKLFETLKIWQEKGVMYMPIMSHIQKQIPQGSGLAKLKNLFFQHDYMRKLHIPLQWVEYLYR